MSQQLYPYRRQVITRLVQIRSPLYHHDNLINCSIKAVSASCKLLPATESDTRGSGICPCQSASRHKNDVRSLPMQTDTAEQGGMGSGMTASALEDGLEVVASFAAVV